jgi:hypothetical protein
MRSDTQTITIAAPPEDVLAFVGDGANLPRWAIGFAKAIQPDGDLDLGHIVATGQVPRRHRPGTGGPPARRYRPASTLVDFHGRGRRHRRGRPRPRAAPRHGAEYVVTLTRRKW